MTEFLLELLSEEIPAGMQDQACADLERLVLKCLGEHRINHNDSQTFATPRRLVLVIDGVDLRQPDLAVERRGPRIDAPEKAREGFLRGLGDADYELGEIDDKKGRFLIARYTQTGRATQDILGPALTDILTQFPWPKSMRWATGETRWVRPLHAISCLFAGEVVKFNAHGIASGAESSGHRFMAPAAFGFHDFAGYQSALSSAFVVLDGNARRICIEQVSNELATSAGLRVRHDPRLIEELKGLIEWPVPLLGRIDDAFMELPSEVLVTSMRAHQKFLALETADGELAPRFITIANIAASDGGRAVIEGNERVLRARLWDAKFFWDQDRKISLEDRLAALEPMVFHAELGSLHDKAMRLEALSRVLAGWIEGADPDKSALAGRLAKADLVTGMVGEFPELQGIMGGYYAGHDGLDHDVSVAIAEHYRFGSEDRASALLSGPVSCAVGLADKLDTLSGFFAAGIKPTGSKDPFALRRMAAGIAWIIRAHGLRIPLRQAIAAALSGYASTLVGDDESAQRVSADIVEFVKQRGNTVEIMTEQANRNDEASYPFNIPSVFQTVLALPDDDLVRLDRLRTALLDLLDTDDGRSLIAAYRRASSILRIETKKDGVDYSALEPDAQRLQAEAEIKLFGVLSETAGPLNGTMQDEDYFSAMQILAGIRPAIDAFFDEVMVNSEEPALRRNRLALLALFCARSDRIADLSLVED